MTIINQSVAILCDGNNIERSIQESRSSNTMLNFDTVIPRLLNGRGLNRLIYFREGKNISKKLAERLHNNYYGSVVPCHKSADIPLSIKATQLASKVDTIIILSGDSDYVDLVSHLKSEGVRVEIAAVKKTTSRLLTGEADYFHPIVDEDLFVFNSNGGPGGDSQKSNGPSKKPPKKDDAKGDKTDSSKPKKNTAKPTEKKKPASKKSTSSSSDKSSESGSGEDNGGFVGSMKKIFGKK
ncbi:MAG: NYN domain-containing protein [Nanobdellota archaeon]